MSDEKHFSIILHNEENGVKSNRIFYITQNYTDTIKKIVCIMPITSTKEGNKLPIYDCYVSPGFEEIYLMEEKSYNSLSTTGQLQDETIEEIFMRCAIDRYSFCQRDDFFRDQETGNTCLVAYKYDDTPEYEY